MMLSALDSGKCHLNGMPYCFSLCFYNVNSYAWVFFLFLGPSVLQYENKHMKNKGKIAQSRAEGLVLVIWVIKVHTENDMMYLIYTS